MNIHIVTIQMLFESSNREKVDKHLNLLIHVTFIVFGRKTCFKKLLTVAHRARISAQSIYNTVEFHRRDVYVIFDNRLTNGMVNRRLRDRTRIIFFAAKALWTTNRRTNSVHRQLVLSVDRPIDEQWSLALWVQHVPQNRRSTVRGQLRVSQTRVPSDHSTLSCARTEPPFIPESVSNNYCWTIAPAVDRSTMTCVAEM
jgi:hypothetical protein